MFTPIAAPRWSTSGPPELPGLSAASVWITLSIRRPSCVRSERPSALTMPAVTVARKPNGLPSAITSCPTRAPASPRGAIGTSSGARRAAAPGRSRDRRRRAAPASALPSASVAVTLARAVTTWLFVTTKPSGVSTKPEPPPSARRPGRRSSRPRGRRSAPRARWPRRRRSSRRRAARASGPAAVSGPARRSCGRALADHHGELALLSGAQHAQAQLAADLVGVERRHERAGVGEGVLAGSAAARRPGRPPRAAGLSGCTESTISAAPWPVLERRSGVRATVCVPIPR